MTLGMLMTLGSTNLYYNICKIFKIILVLLKITALILKMFVPRLRLSSNYDDDRVHLQTE